MADLQSLNDQERAVLAQYLALKSGGVGNAQALMQRVLDKMTATGLSIYEVLAPELPNGLPSNLDWSAYIPIVMGQGVPAGGDALSAGEGYAPAFDSSQVASEGPFMDDFFPAGSVRPQGTIVGGIVKRAAADAVKTAIPQVTETVGNAVGPALEKVGQAAGAVTDFLGGLLPGGGSNGPLPAPAPLTPEPDTEDIAAGKYAPAPASTALTTRRVTTIPIDEFTGLPEVSTAPIGAARQAVNEMFSGDVLSLSDEDRELLARAVATEVDPRIAQSDPEAYALQVYRVADTILNRVTSGQFAEGGLAAVLNERNQFSAINGPTKGRNYQVYGAVENVPAERADPKLRAILDEHLDRRYGGAPSTVGGSLNYANPKAADAKNLPWIKALSGPRDDAGPFSHWYGTADGLVPSEARLAPFTDLGAGPNWNEMSSPRNVDVFGPFVRPAAPSTAGTAATLAQTLAHTGQKTGIEPLRVKAAAATVKSNYSPYTQPSSGGPFVDNSQVHGGSKSDAPSRPSNYSPYSQTPTKQPTPSNYTPYTQPAPKPANNNNATAGSKSQLTGTTKSNYSPYGW